MLSRIIKWWNNNSGEYIDDESHYLIDNEVYEDEFSYQSTIKTNLEKIVDLLSTDFPDHLVKEKFEYKFSNEVSIHVKNSNNKEFRKYMISKLNLKTLYMTSEGSSYHRWIMTYYEYDKTFNSKSSVYIKGKLNLY